MHINVHNILFNLEPDPYLLLSIKPHFNTSHKTYAFTWQAFLPGPTVTKYFPNFSKDLFISKTPGSHGHFGSHGISGSSSNWGELRSKARYEGVGRHPPL